jgi:serine/threonine protein phosphatase PrpC
MTEPFLLIGRRSDTGPVRERNEDYVDYCVPEDETVRQVKGALFLVADGMGGHRAGQVASRTAVECTRQEYYTDPAANVQESLERAFKMANREVHDKARSDPAMAGMGTTLVAAIIRDRGKKAIIANVGDSRAYLLRGKQLTQITVDHSWVEAQFRAGLLTRKQAEKHPQRNLITRALGIHPSVEVDLFERKLRKGDSLLLCTDGVSGELSEERMAEIVRTGSPAEAAAELVARANAQGGNDNATALVVRAEPGAGLLGPAPAPAHRAEMRQYRGLAAGLVILALLCLASALLATALLNRSESSWPEPQASPRSGPIHFEWLESEALADLAQELGYPDVETMQSQSGNEVNLEAQEAVLWPAERGVFLVGQAQACLPQSGACDFVLEVAGTKFQVDLEGDSPARAYPGQRVWVFGYQAGEVGAVVARQVDVLTSFRGRYGWPPSVAWLRPRWTTAYRVRDGHEHEPAWVYAIVDDYPNSPMHGLQPRTLNRGEPVLIHGRWHSGQGIRPMILTPDEIYRLDEGENSYILVQTP